MNVGTVNPLVSVSSASDPLPHLPGEMQWREPDLGRKSTLSVKASLDIFKAQQECSKERWPLSRWSLSKSCLVRSGAINARLKPQFLSVNIGLTQGRGGQGLRIPRDPSSQSS